MTPPPGARSGDGVVVDLQATQSPTSRGRGIGRYATAWANALERLDDRVVSTYLLNPDLPPPGDLGDLVASGKVRYRGSPDMPERIAVFHTLSPLDTALRPTAIWPSFGMGADVLRSAMVYDLIPALDPDAELRDPVVRRQYRTLFAELGHVDGVMTLAGSVGDDLARLGIAPRAGVTVIGGAPDPRLIPPSDRRAVASVVAATFGCAPRFVYLPTGSHPRKNNERAVAAFASLPPEIRGDRQVLITGDIDAPTRNHYEAIAAGFDAPGSVVVAGYVTDEMMLRCFQGAELVCFPSLAEGFGFPVVDAFAAGARVVASDRPPFNDLVPVAGRFDPMSVPSITATIASALTGSDDLATPLVPIDRWSDVAGRSIDAFDRLRRAETPRPRRGSSRRRRPRLAFVSPFPPAPTGVAGYSARLVEKIAATGKVDLTCFWDGPVRPTPIPGIEAPVHVGALDRFEALEGRFDRVIFTLGNSHHHIGALDALLRRGGSVIAHDVRLSNLYRHRHGDPGVEPHGLKRTVAAMYNGTLPRGLGHYGEIAATEIEQYGVLMARDAIDRSDRFFVTSHAALGLARVDAGAGGSGRLDVLTFAVGRPDPTDSFADQDTPVPHDLEPNLASTWGSAPPTGVGPIVATFGIVDPVKSPTLLVEMAALLSRSFPSARITFVGPVSDALARQIGEVAETHGIADRVVLTGPLPTDRYLAWMAATSVAVQLRSSTNGEASATIGECLSVGVPTVATASGWARELPSGTLDLVPPAATADELAGVVAAILGDRSRQRALREAGIAYAAAHTFDRAARDLLTAVL